MPKHAIALSDFTSSDKAASFMKNTIIEILQVDPSGFYYYGVDDKNQVGWFPKSCVTDYDIHSSADQANTKNSGYSLNDSNLKNTEGLLDFQLGTDTVARNKDVSEEPKKASTPRPSIDAIPLDLEFKIKKPAPRRPSSEYSSNSLELVLENEPAVRKPAPSPPRQLSYTDTNSNTIISAGFMSKEQMEQYILLQNVGRSKISTNLGSEQVYQTSSIPGSLGFMSKEQMEQFVLIQNLKATADSQVFIDHLSHETVVNANEEYRNCHGKKNLAPTLSFDSKTLSLHGLEEVKPQFASVLPSTPKRKAAPSLPSLSELNLATPTTLNATDILDPNTLKTQSNIQSVEGVALKDSYLETQRKSAEKSAEIRPRRNATVKYGMGDKKVLRYSSQDSDLSGDSERTNTYVRDRPKTELLQKNDSDLDYKKKNVSELSLMEKTKKKNIPPPPETVNWASMGSVNNIMINAQNSKRLESKLNSGPTIN
eukprot:NODE_178_length_15814_cov_0.338657.p4 type:complete len:482 gc:universal NODE_178_length_15814_cov_0.338657:7633-9078(+)